MRLIFDWQSATGKEALFDVSNFSRLVGDRPGRWGLDRRLRRSLRRRGADAGASRTRAIQNKGSDTMVNLALAWAEAYRKVKPDVDIAVTGGGSGTGIAALINGTVDIANASREMKDNEIADAQKNGINPVEHTVAVDALAVIVNKQNPVSQLTIDQLSDIFTGRITNWKEVGGNDAPIVLVSRETNSGTHVYFLEEVVRKGDKENKDVFAPQTLLMPSSVGITSEVQRNPHAIGYDGLGYVDTDDGEADRGRQGRQLALRLAFGRHRRRRHLPYLARPLYVYDRCAQHRHRRLFGLDSRPGRAEDRRQSGLCPDTPGVK